jgi:GNAT superfamily N-acetyltransferase
VTATDLPGLADELGELLACTVAAGASLGFLAPLDPAHAAAWWLGNAPELAEGWLRMWVARDGGDDTGRLLGTVQVQRGRMANGAHRGEVRKLMVHPAGRGRGVGRALLAHVEDEARRSGARLLVLDTETGSPAERLYRGAGWTEAGVVPDFATDPHGELRPTTIFYKRLTPTPAGAS